jgi:hypothetical protein
MGANAVTTVPVYTAGEILTAADLNITNSGIPVFANSTDRDAAFGGSGEKVLAEGQYAYLESTNQTLYYDGASWLAVGTSGLTYVGGATAPGSSSSMSINNVFSATYKNYLIVSNLYTSSASQQLLYAKMRLSGTDASTNYDYLISYMTSGAGPTRDYGTGGTLGLFFGYCSNNAGGATATVTLANPAIASATSLTSISNSLGTGTYQILVGGSTHTTATAYDGITFSVNGGNLTGDVRIYGIANS